jgi:hypothetical protein
MATSNDDGPLEHITGTITYTSGALALSYSKISETVNSFLEAEFWNGT